jgi:hypothetical protein
MKSLGAFRVAMSRSTFLAIAAVSIIAVAAGWTAFGLTTTTSHLQQQSTSSVRASESGGDNNENWATSTAGNGIMMNATIAPISVEPGQKVYLNTEAFNTLSTPNNVSAKNDWALPSLAGPCPGGLFSQALYQGYYTSANISSATPVSWNGPGGTSCPYFDTAYYIFRPDSYNLSAFAAPPNIVYPTTEISCNTENVTNTYTGIHVSNATGHNVTTTTGVQTVTIRSLTCTSSTVTGPTSTTSTGFPSGGYSFNATGEFPFEEYYDQNSSSMVNFAPGQYSFLVGDIWDSYVILYFKVT